MGSSGQIAGTSGLHYCVDCSTVLELRGGEAAPTCPTCNHGTTWFSVRHSVESAPVGNAYEDDFEE